LGLGKASTCSAAENSANTQALEGMPRTDESSDWPQALKGILRTEHRF